MRKFRRLHLCGKYVTLHLTKGNWAARQGAVGMENRIVGIFPALIDKARSRLPRIFDKAVPIRIAKRVDPSQSCLDIRPDRVDRSEVSSPVEVHSSQHDKEWRGIDSPVIVSEWHFTKARHFPVPGFMQNLARLCLGKRIEGFCLSLGEEAENAFGDGRVEPQKQHGRDDPVTAEYRAVPRDSRVGVNPMAG